MQKYQRNNFKWSANFFKKTARRPFTAFFILLLLAISAALYVYYIYQHPVLSEDAGDGKTKQKTVFNTMKTKNYRDIFAILEQREKDYLNKPGTVFPEIFLVSRDKEKDKDKAGILTQGFANASSTVIIKEAAD